MVFELFFYCVTVQTKNSDLPQQDGWKTQDGRMTKKCHARLCIPGLAHFPLWARIVVRTSNWVIFMWSFGRLRQRNVFKGVPCVQHYCFSSFNQSCFWFVILSLPKLKSVQKLPKDPKWAFDCTQLTALYCQRTTLSIHGKFSEIHWTCSLDSDSENKNELIDDEWNFHHKF